jgi:hypothetical protein
MKESINEMAKHRIDFAGLRRLQTSRPSSVGVEAFVGFAKVGKGRKHIYNTTGGHTSVQS